MKLAFFHDTIFKIDEDNNIYSHLLTMKVWKRYLAVFNDIIITARKKNLNSANLSDLNGLIPVNGKHLTFNLLEKYTGSSGKILSQIKNLNQTNNQIKSALIKSDASIMRLPSVVGLLACRQAIRLKKPWAVEVVACAYDGNINHKRLINRLFTPFLYFFTKHYVKKAPFALYVTSKFLQNRYKNNNITTNVSNVEIELPDEEVLLKRLNKIDNLNKNTVLNFGVVGSLDVGFKGHYEAMTALSKIKDKLPCFKLKFIGPGNPKYYYDLAKKLQLSDNFEFNGLLPNGKKVFEWMDNLDVFLIPSLQEGLPRALIEAMSRGCPSLGADTGGIIELIDYQFLHKKKDTNKLSLDILNLINNKDLMKTQAVDNFNKSKEFCNEILNAKRTEFWMKYKNSIL
jgi:Glycosyltransferase